jgi:hypothetical protein
MDNQLSVFGQVCRPGESVRIAFDDDGRFVPCEDLAAFVFEVQIEAEHPRVGIVYHDRSDGSSYTLTGGTLLAVLQGLLTIG